MAKASSRAQRDDADSDLRSVATGRAVPEGRSLSDFLPLRRAEKKLAAACEKGELASVSAGRPEAKSRANSVRAEFLRFLALGGDQQAPVHERGIQLDGACVEGALDLQGCNIVRRLYFIRCRFPDGINATSSILNGLEVENSHISFLEASLVRCQANLFIREECDVEGLVNLQRSHIVGALSFRGSRFSNGDMKAIDCSHAKIGGGVYCNRGFVASGLIRFYRCDVEGDFTFMLGSFKKSEGHEVAITCEGSNVSGALYFKNVVQCIGRVNFTALHVRTLVDDFDSWQLAEPVLDGFTYQRLGAGGTDATRRIAWLRGQRRTHLGDSFRPQPWEHLTKVLREMGHLEGAKRIAIEKQLVLREAGLIGHRSTDGNSRLGRWINIGLNDITMALHWAYGKLAGFGYRPLKTAGWMAFAWILCAVAYAAAARDGLFGPTNPRIYADAQFSHCGDGGDPGKQNWTNCASLPPEHTLFSPLMYSLDVILPLVDLKQEADWAPIVHSANGRELALGHEVRLLMWLEIFFGWIGSLLLVSVVGRLIERD